ncbi:MAG: ATPase [Anaerotignum sp.]
MGTLFDSWSWNRRLPAPFDDPAISMQSHVNLSKYNLEKTKTATLHGATLSAILQMVELYTMPFTDDMGAIGTQGENLYIAEYPSKTGELHTVVFNRNSGRFYAGRYDDVSQPPKPYILKESEQSGSALIFALLNIAMQDSEFMEHFDELCNHKVSGYPDLAQAAVHAYVLCDNIYRRVKNAEKHGNAGIVVNLPSTGNIQTFTAIALNKGTYNPDTVLWGKFRVFTVSATAGKRKTRAMGLKDFVGQFKLRERVFSEAETALIPKLEKWYVVPDEVTNICKHAQLTTESNRPMRNFLIRGNAGTGKTEGAKAIAAGLGLPYLYLTCSANTEIFDVLGQMMPVTEGKNVSMEYPTFEDIRMDAATAYFKLTGDYVEEITEDQVYEKLLEVIASDAKAKDSDKQQFAYVESPLIQAMRKGYVLELQEPTVISNPGVLVGLNSLLDNCGAITLPTGERVERHPDTVVVVTTNVDYEGCRSLNQSILSRMDIIVDMEEPDINTLVKRVSGITGCKEKDAVKMMAGIVSSIQKKCRMEMIDDGCCGMRELISWVQSYMICGDMLEAAEYTILSSVSADAENRKAIRTTCLEPLLKS